MPGKREAANLLPAERTSDCETRPDTEGKNDRGAQRSNLRCSCPAAHLAACMRAQDVKAQLKKPQRQKLPWMNDDEGKPAASGDLLRAAAATATAAATEASATAGTEAAMAAAAAEAAVVAMVATETEPAEAAEVVQAHLLPLPQACINHPFSHRLS